MSPVFDNQGKRASSVIEPDGDFWTLQELNNDNFKACAEAKPSKRKVN